MNKTHNNEIWTVIKVRQNNSMNSANKDNRDAVLENAESVFQPKLYKEN